MSKKNAIIGLAMLFAITNVRGATAWGKLLDSADVTKPVATLAPLDMYRVAVITAMLPQIPQGFGDNYHNRSTWDRLHRDPKYLKVIKTAEGLLNKPFPVWSDEQYL